MLARRAIGKCAPVCRLLIDVCRGKMFSRASSLCSALRAVRALARADRDRRRLHGADAGAWGARDLGGSRRRSRAGGACGNVDVNRLSLPLVLARRSAHAVPSLHSPRRRPAGGARTASRRARRVARGERSAGARESSCCAFSVSPPSEFARLSSLGFGVIARRSPIRARRTLAPLPAPAAGERGERSKPHTWPIFRLASGFLSVLWG